MIRLHERQLAMLVLHFCLRYTIQCITRAPRVQYYLEWAPHQIVPSQALLSQSDTGKGYQGGVHRPRAEVVMTKTRSFQIRLS